MGADLGALDDDQATFLIRAMRHDAAAAEEYFTDLLHRRVTPLRAPVISVVGDRDPGVEYYQERFREWHFVAGTTALVVIDEGGHYFLKFRAGELAEILTTVHTGLEQPVAPPDGDPSWRLTAVSAAPAATAPAGPRPSMRRFLAIAAGQLISMTGTALTEFAVPLYIYLTTGSLVRFALFAVLGLVPGMLVAPFAGAIVDRVDRRGVMLAGDVAAGGLALALGMLLWTDQLQTWHLYGFVSALSVALAFQRIAYNASVPQLVPKQYLGHANGVLQVAAGTAQFIVPLLAVGLMAAIGLDGILVFDIVSYAVAITVLLFLRFPRTMGHRRREGLLAEIAGGVRYSVGQRGFRAMLAFFAVLNVFLAPLFLLISPLVLSFDTVTSVGRVALAGGAGGILGGIVMLVWGGPRRRRLRGVFVATLALAAGAVVTGVDASAVVIAVGAFWMSLALAVVNGIYATIIQTKVPQRLHGRVIALNTVAAWSTLPLAWAVVAPVAAALAEPLLRDGGALAPTVGAVIGVGPGRGIGFAYLVFAACIAGVVGFALRTRTLARFDEDVPDAPPDDVVGLESRRSRATVATAVEKKGAIMDDARYQVVVNHEEQYSIWRADQDPPAGWRVEGTSGSRQECLDHIDRVWTDMRPLSAR
jgi:uncharacterized protein YbdZ (MbtH family)/MFS family permease